MSDLQISSTRSKWIFYFQILNILKIVQQSLEYLVVLVSNMYPIRILHSLSLLEVFVLPKHPVPCPSLKIEISAQNHCVMFTLVYLVLKFWSMLLSLVVDLLNFIICIAKSFGRRCSDYGIFCFIWRYEDLLVLPCIHSLSFLLTLLVKPWIYWWMCWVMTQ